MKSIKLLFVLFLFPIMLYSQTGKVLKSFKAPGKFCVGLTFDGKHLWASDRKADKLFELDMENGNVLRTIESPAYFPTGLAFDGENLWNADIRGVSDVSEDLDGKIFKVNRKDGTILKTLKSPVHSPRGLTWDGKYLWCVDETKDLVIQFNPDDGTTINSFPSPSTDPQGITFDGKYLWISDRIKDEIYMVEPSNGTVIIIMDAPGKHVKDLTFDGKNIWCIDFQDDMIYKLAIRDGVKYSRKDQREQVVTYSHQTKVFGPGELINMQAHIALPQNRINQELIGDFKYSFNPTKIITDQWGQQTSMFEYNNIKSGTRIDAEVTTKFRSWTVRYFLYPEEMGTLEEIPSDIREKYLVDNEKYQINHPAIQKVVKEIVGDEKNPYWIMRKIHQYLIGHLHYIMDGYWDTAPTVIRNGHGSCSEYTFTFVAICRAAGLPAKYVGSTWMRKDEASFDNVFHRWVEVYLPGFGWVATDPTHGDRSTPRDQAFPIGYVSNLPLITTESGGGSTTMGWTYNSNEFYTTQPKTNINIEFFADWMLSK